jgi:hypothetical protein
MPDECVGADEVLHRSVRREWAVFRGGKLTLTSQAFNDTGLKPSVDRAKMRSAEESKRGPTDGICSLIADEVRGITTVLHQQSKMPYEVDVKWRPILPENPAHAQIEVEPEFENKTRFNKLKDALCRLASERGWVIEPAS